MRSKGTAAELEARRRLAVQRVGDGWTQRAVAEFLGVSERAVNGWVAAHRAAGGAALAARPHPGRRPSLTPTQEHQVFGWLARKPTEFGFPPDLWTARRVAAPIHERLGARFHPSCLREWLARRDYTPQRPARRAKERDPAGVARWVAEDWPATQRKRRRTAPTSS